MTAYRAIGAKHPDPLDSEWGPSRRALLGSEERKILKETGSESVLAALAMDTESAWASLGNTCCTGVHVRTRHIDDVLEKSLGPDTTQVVNLGAGLDSRAYRFGRALVTYASSNSIFPQHRNTRRTVFVTCSARCLAMSPTCRSILRNGTSQWCSRRPVTIERFKTVFIWEGVTMYIPEAAVDATLRFVAQECRPGQPDRVRLLSRECVADTPSRSSGNLRAGWPPWGNRSYLVCQARMPGICEAAGTRSRLGLQLRRSQ